MAKNELAAMEVIYEALEPLDDSARRRVLSWVSQRFDIDSRAPIVNTHAPQEIEPEPQRLSFASLAELFNAVSPGSNAEKALVAGYWLQICQNEEQFTSQAVNKELQNLGHALANVTDAFSQLQQKKPALAIQLRKSGKSRQARKLYKITQAGIDMIKKP